MSKITIFTGLTNISQYQLGEAQDYIEIAKLLQKEGHQVKVIIPNQYKDKEIELIQYNPDNIKKIVKQSDIVIAGAYAPTSPLYWAYIYKKPIVLKLYEPAPISSLEFSDFKDKQKHQILNNIIPMY